MSLRPLTAVSVLMLGDWGLWTWSINSDHSTTSLLAGMLMAPLFVAFAWLATVAATQGVRFVASRLRPVPQRTRPQLAEPVQAEEREQRIAA